MTEDIIGWALVFGLPILVGAVVIYFVRRSVRKAAEATARRAAAIEKLREGRQRLGGFGTSKFINNKPPAKTSTTTATPAPTSSISDDLMTMMILNQALNSTTGAVAATVDRDNSGAIKSYSWDSPSSSSVDDTPTKSSSWSSSSSSDWSSSSDSSSSSSWD